MIRALFPAAALAACLASPALADADAAIKYRQNAMKAVGSQIGSIVAILKGEVDNKAALAQHAALMGAVTSTAITIPAFEPNTAGVDSRETTATANIWTEWAKFGEGLLAMEKAGQAVAVAGADVTFDEIKELGATCKACHDDFREK
ncbi:MAG TPA: cytochrome c [Alphaproteobacteria bacterium]|nr:cytochrome c [Alphaproteobacteria bacterium]